MSGFSNFAVSFTIISILSGCLTLYGYGMNTGGPAIIVWGWPIVGLFTLTVGLAMAEVCSSFPTAGGLYYWSAKLARTNGPAWSWFTGWFNFLGQVAVTAGIDFGCAFFINAFLNLMWGVSTAHWVTILILAIVLFVHGLMNQFGIKLVALLNDISVWWHVIGVLIIVAVLAFVPSKHASASYVFSHIVNNTGWGSTFYVLLLGLLLAQYTLTGFDASAHMTEETHNAARSGPRGIVMSIVVSLIAGWVLLIGVTFAIQKRALRALHRRAGAAGPDLGHRDRRHRGQAAAARGHRRPAVLRDVLGHRELADDLRVLPGRGAARLDYLAPGEQADQDADQRDLAGRGRRVHPGPAVPVERRGLRRGHLDRGHRPVHRLRDCRRSCGCGRARTSSAGPGTWAGGAT